MAYYLYIVADNEHEHLFTGVCNNLNLRMAQHKMNSVPENIREFKFTKLLYYETYDLVEAAKRRAKELQEKPARVQMDLINRGNPRMNDLAKGMGLRG